MKSYRLGKGPPSTTCGLLYLQRGVTRQDLVGFLETAAEIWLAHARRDKILPATFYAWY